MKEYLDELIATKKAIVSNGKQTINYLREAYIFGAENSTDKDTWTGSVIVKDDVILHKGANRFPDEIEPTKEMMERPGKYEAQNHSERDAIYKAARYGPPIDGSIMYMPWVPCYPCANAIVNSGIKELVIHYNKTVKTPKDWLPSVKSAVDYLLRAKIRIIVVDQKIGDCENLFRGEIWYP